MKINRLPELKKQSQSVRSVDAALRQDCRNAPLDAGAELPDWLKPISNGAPAH